MEAALRRDMKTVLVALTLLLAACALPAEPTTPEGATTTPDTAGSSEQALSTETLKLYEQPGFEPDPSCDVHTVLTLSTWPASDSKEPFPPSTLLSARLVDVVTGTCDRRVDTEPRSYRLLLGDVGCGSKMYFNLVTRAEPGPWELTMTDHRERVCKDVVPAKLIIEEKSSDGAIRTFYSRAGDAARP